MEMPDFGKKHLYAATALILVAGLAVVHGVPVFTADSTCYTETKLCHGIPAGDSCLGYESFRESFVQKSQCGIVANISAKCADLGERICGLNNRSIGTSWAEKTRVYGQNCRTWNREYGIELEPC